MRLIPSSPTTRCLCGHLTVISGGGNDPAWPCWGAEVDGDLAIDARSGDDIVGASHGTSVTGVGTVRGGNGRDTFATDGTTGIPRLVGVESVIDSDLEDLIDLALSNFDDLFLDR